MSEYGLVNLVGLLALGAAWLVTVRLVFARRSSEGDDLMQRGMTIAGWILVVLGVLGLLAVFVGPVAFAVWPVFMVIVSMAVNRFRQNERRSLLWALALAAERGIPLEQAANAFADERYDETGLRAARLAKGLERGEPLPDALRSSRNWLPFDAQLACRVGWQGGCLGPALRQVIDFQEEFEQYRRGALEKFLYLSLLTAGICAMLTMLFYRIVPALSLIYADFGIELPWPTALVFDGTTVFLGGMYWFAFIPVYFGVFVVAVLSILYYQGWVWWEPWLVRRLWRRFHTAWILRYLAFVVGEGRPLDQGVQLLAANYPATYIAQRLYTAAGLIAGGRHWCDALLARGLIRSSEAGALRAAERAGNLRWVLVEMSESNLRRLGLRFRAFLSIVFPSIIIVFGLFLFAIIVSIFMPFTQVVEKLG